MIRGDRNSFGVPVSAEGFPASSHTLRFPVSRVLYVERFSTHVTWLEPWFWLLSAPGLCACSNSNLAGKGRVPAGVVPGDVRKRERQRRGRREGEGERDKYDLARQNDGSAFFLGLLARRLFWTTVCFICMGCHGLACLLLFQAAVVELDECYVQAHTEGVTETVMLASFLSRCRYEWAM